MAATLRNIVAVTAASIMQPAIRMDPEDELRIAMCEFANGVAPPWIVQSQKRESLRSDLTTD